MIVYADASATARPYLEEPHREELTALLLRAELRTTHVFSYVEVVSAFSKARRVGRITDVAAFRAKFDKDWLSFDRISAHETIMGRAAALVECHELRVADALHLAASEQVARAVPASSFVFASFDLRQSRAALELGMRLPDFVHIEG